jgi:hypothetical protein
MLGKTTAIMLAAACATVIVVFMPGFAQPVSANTAPSIQQTAVADPGNRTEPQKLACTQSWPFYEIACLHDDRQPGGKARIVRVIRLDRQASR